LGVSINHFYKEFIMTIRFIGGLWRRIDGNTIKSFTTYQQAVDNKTSWEDLAPQTTSDDIAAQMKQ
jgi:hypothetical protein